MRRLLFAALLLLAPAALAQEAAQPAPPAGPAERGLEQQVMVVLNKVRANPAGYAQALAKYRTYFDGNVVMMPGSEVGLRTREGVAAVDEAIAFLKKQKPMPPFIDTPVLAETARELAVHQALQGGTDHVGPDGSDAKVRMQRRGAVGFMAEALAYGPADAAAIVRQLIIDDGVPTRPHRKILFDKRYFKAGVACGPHPFARSMCVIDFATSTGGLNPIKPRQAPVERPDIR
jgi:uncharacterized protein YkwD